jgi:hypothetical protein
MRASAKAACGRLTPRTGEKEIIAGIIRHEPQSY